MPDCGVEGCENEATLEVILYDFYSAGDFPEGTLHFVQDETCPFICAAHAAENEEGMNGERTPRKVTHYPFTNLHGAQGFTFYKPLPPV